MAGFGNVATALERVTYRDARISGVIHVGLLVSGTTLLGRRVPVAVATWVVVGGRTLDREAAEVQRLLSVGELDAARRQVSRLVGRDTSALDEFGVARAALESVAENTSDAVVTPLFWGALLGTPGLMAYRAVNTLDAMVGHHNSRYERFGWAAARFDDLVNLPGARLTAALTVLLGADHAGAYRAWIRDARHHPSPNAGPVEAAFAGALGVRLGGVNSYAGQTEDRHVLGDGRAPNHEDLARGRALAKRVSWAALAVCAATRLLLRRR